MEFSNINDIKKFILHMRNSYNEDSELYKELDWFTTNNYTTSSEYFGELMLFIEELINDKDINKNKEDLIKLSNKLKSYFN